MVSTSINLKVAQFSIEVPQLIKSGSIPWGSTAINSEAAQFRAEVPQLIQKRLNSVAKYRN
ncbi:hypothetical protein [Terrilactibacillus laevilacticus]|uniref:hypothetical protein n=1 Tax=Terrilactibacillus laevilacticus TaxID=1380157 RepID=UPI00113FE1E0|nr:hypothetical protein [Terrilactibacillus laevilacticus]